MSYVSYIVMYSNFIVLYSNFIATYSHRVFPDDLLAQRIPDSTALRVRALPSVAAM